MVKTEESLYNMTMGRHKKINKLTAVILTKNSAKDLVELLPTLDWVGRILVVDDNSNDETVEIAKKYGAKVLPLELKDNWADHRNKALRQVQTTWTWFIDADERVTKELAQEIRQALKRPGKIGGFKIPRLDVVAGKKIGRGEIADQSPVRLARAKAGKWKRPVHEYWDVSPVKTLSSPILHYSHNRFGQSVNKIRRYAKIEADYRLANKDQLNILHLLTYPLGKFVHNMVIKKGILDGWRGWYMAILMSYHSFLVRYFQLKHALEPKVVRHPLTRILRIGVFSVLIAYPLGHLTRIQLDQVTAIYVFELIMIVTIGVWVIDVFRRRESVTVPKIGYGLLTFTLALGLSLAVNWQSLAGLILPASLYWFRWILYAVFMLVLWDAKRAGWINLPVRKTLIYMGSAVMVFGWIQYIVIPDMRWLFWFGWDDHYYRMVGTLFDPGYFALIMVLLLLALGSNWRQHTIVRVMTILALMLTYARSGYLVFILGLMIYAMWRGSYKIFLVGVLAFVLLLTPISMLIQPGGEGVNLARTFTVVHRARSVVTGWDIFVNRPIFGIGFNAYRFEVEHLFQPDSKHIPIHPSAPDSSPVLVLATAGIVGFISFVIMIAHWLYLSRGVPWVFTSIAVIIAHSMTNNSFFYPWVLLWIGIMISQTAKSSGRKAHVE